MNVALQNLSIEPQYLGPIEQQPFIKITHRSGDSNIKVIILTPAEAKYLMNTLEEVYGA